MRPILELYGVAYPPLHAEVGPGWVELVTNLLEDLVKMGWDKNLIQIKQKFGGMRFYVGGELPKNISERIDRAERESYETCEMCGAKVDDPKQGYSSLCGAC